MATADVLVVGAGMAGLTAAVDLSAAGLSVVVVDKGRGVGGRLATRRLGAARIDHGAQFFTVRHDGFRRRVQDWEQRGVVREWCRGFREPADGHPRYVGATGMTDLAKDLAAGLDVRVATRVAAVTRVDGGWGVELEAPSAEPLEGRAVLLTPPAAQTVALLAAGRVPVPEPARAALEAIRYDPTLAALVALDGPPAVPPPGGVQREDGLIRWVGDNGAKGISPVPALTLHASGGDSAARWDDPADASLAALLDAGAPWLGGAAVVEAQLMRWRYAQPTVAHDERCLVAVDGPEPLVCAGDAFGEPRVEGAALSGRAAADAVLARLT